MVTAGMKLVRRVLQLHSGPGQEECVPRLRKGGRKTVRRLGSMQPVVLSESQAWCSLQTEAHSLGY